MHDLVIKGGTVVDGTGAAGRTADVAISDGRVTEVGQVDGDARRVIDADGAARHARLRRHPHPLRRPGHVGPAAHAVVLARRHHRRHGQLRRRLRAGRAGAARLADRPDGRRRGHPRRGAVGRASSGAGSRSPSTSTRSTALPKSIDIGTQVPHGAVRGFVMGERGARNEPATAEDIEAMAAIVREGIEAGALGFSTSRTLAHRAIDGEPVPGHVRRGGRAVRHRPRARRPRHRRVRARARRRARAKTWPRPRRRWTGCAGCRPRSAVRSPSR